MESISALEAETDESQPLNRIAAGAGVVAMTAGAGAVWYFDPAKIGLFPVCPLYSYTGFACPGCGLTRGFHALFHGDLVAALDFNALIPIWAALFGYLFLSLLFFVFRGRSLPIRQPNQAAVWVLMIGLLSFGVLRNLPYYPFSLLYP